MHRNHIVMIESNGRTGLNAIRIIKENLLAEVTFVTCDLKYYLKGSTLAETPLKDADLILEIENTNSLNLMTAQLEKLNDEHPIKSILTFNDLHTPITAKLCEHFGFKHLSSQAVTTARNKILTRKTLQDAHIPQPRFLNLDQKLQNVIKLGFPAVVKPSDGTGSLYTKVVFNYNELEEHIKFLFSVEEYGRGVTLNKEILIEEYLEGPLFSVEVITVNGKHHVLGICDRVLQGFPFFVEVENSFPYVHPKFDEFVNITFQALDAIGVDFGPTHTELILTKEGAKIIEINPRLAGGAIPELMAVALNRNIVLDVVRMHLGEVIQVDFHPTRFATEYCFHTSKKGILKKIIPSPRSSGPYVHSQTFSKHPGDCLKGLQNNFDLLGILVVSGNTLEESQQLAHSIAKETRFVVGKC